MKKKHSWATIGVVLLFLFPVGIYMLVQKVTSEKDRYAQNGKGLKTLAIVLFCMSVVYIVMGLSGQVVHDDGTPAYESAIIMPLVLCPGGLAALIKGKQYMARGEVYSDFAARFHAGETLNIDEVASKQKISFDAAVADLQGLIGVGYLENAKVDRIGRKVIHTQPVAKLVTLVCPHCDGSNEFPEGAIGCCIYCDSPLIGQ